MFTVARLGIDGRLAKTLTTSEPHRVDDLHRRTTNRNVTRWRDGQMVLRWTAAGMLNAERSFRRIKGRVAGGSRPPAPTDPYVNLSVHTALVILITRRRGRRWSSPVGEKPRVLFGDPLPRLLELASSLEPAVFLADPTHQVGVDARQERIQR